ncbi:MAG: hypothetical protein RI573_14835 [Balneolaceae bacterium]|nr:hypothetical protein [Balneolaceae bacterium]
MTILILNISCDQKPQYHQLIERELEKNVRNDSLFLGYSFGMEREVFFDHSWNLNQEGTITGTTVVEYQIDDLEHSATMSFFPEFKNDKIYKMPIEVQYDAWAPWNKNLFSDSLIVELVDKYEEIYGEGFIRTMHPRYGKESWVKVDGNREIAIFKKDDMKARVVFLDLTVEEGNQ